MKLILIDNKVYKVKNKKYYTLIALRKLEDSQPYEDYLRTIRNQPSFLDIDGTFNYYNLFKDDYNA
jgi:hypothetical protein